MFWKTNWTNWEHVLYLEDFNSGTYELFKRTHINGLNQYKRIKITSGTPTILNKLTQNENINKSC
jgi:hypothetical protein